VVEDNSNNSSQETTVAMPEPQTIMATAPDFKAVVVTLEVTIMLVVVEEMVVTQPSQEQVPDSAERKK